MSVIKILSSELAGRIAAGEVIERPASVVKELVENSIDAGAHRIRIVIEQGGHRLIQVVDDGCGMDREDAMMCLEAHATSKITRDGDVGQIRTLGFRGEALPSISSVSRFQLQTRMRGALTGTEVLVNNGTIENVGDCGCPEGTNIRVGYLFGNLPARRKFLKGPASEEAYIEEMVLLLALSRPDIAFELVMNKRTVHRLPPADSIGVRAAMLVGKETFAEMLPVDFSEDGVHVYGFISKPGFTRNSRREQRVVINGRAASAETVYFAIRNAYDTLVMKGRYPSAILYIDLPADRVDVNVHPAKREVRFREPLKISAIVGAALRGGLRSLAGGYDGDLPLPVQNDWRRKDTSDGLPPVVVFSKEGESEEVPGGSPLLPESGTDISGASASDLPRLSRKPAVPSVQKPVISLQNAGTVFPAIQPELPVGDRPADRAAMNGVSGGSPCQGEEPRVAGPAGGGLNVRMLSPLGSQYLLAESDNGLVVINIRAAQRRIAFERLMASLKERSEVRQQLLLPVTLNLSPSDSRFLEQRLESFSQMGFSIEPFGGHTYLVSAVPPYVKDVELVDMLRDIISDLREDVSADRQSIVCLARIAANRISVSGKPLAPDEQQRLVHQLLACEMPYACPNGLPTMLHITFSELERRFGK